MLPGIAAALVADAVARKPESSGMVWIAGGTFLMGSDHHYPEEAPSHDVSVDGFWIDTTPVTNAQFEAFVTATGAWPEMRASSMQRLPPSPAFWLFSLLR